MQRLSCRKEALDLGLLLGRLVLAIGEPEPLALPLIWKAIGADSLDRDLGERSSCQHAAPPRRGVQRYCISVDLWARLGLRWLQKAGGNILAMLNVRVLWTAEAYSQQINQGQREPY